MFPPVIFCNLAALTIAVIYYGWRDGYARKRLPARVLRERVAYMLWQAAHQSERKNQTHVRRVRLPQN